MAEAHRRAKEGFRSNDETMHKEVSKALRGILRAKNQQADLRFSVFRKECRNYFTFILRLMQRLIPVKNHFSSSLEINLLSVK